jgi:hypothetical protein
MAKLKTPNLAPAIPDQPTRTFLQFMRDDMNSMNLDKPDVVIRDVKLSSKKNTTIRIADRTILGAIPILYPEMLTGLVVKKNAASGVDVYVELTKASVNVTFLLLVR